MVSEPIRLFEETGARLLHAESTIDDLRALMREVVARATPMDGEVVERHRAPSGLWIRHESVAPDTSDVIVWFHGGAYVAGQPEQVRPMATALSAGTRARGSSRRPTASRPSTRVLRRSTTPSRPIAPCSRVTAPEHLVIGGDSAGGGLALGTLLALRDAGVPLPAAVVTFSAWTDLALTGDSLEMRRQFAFGITEPFMRRCAGAYLSGRDAFDPRVSPLYGEWAGMPPMHVQVGDHEVLLADSTRLAEAARAAGVAVDLEVWPEMPHVHQGLAGVAPEADEALARAAAFVRTRLADAETARVDVGHE